MQELIKAAYAGAATEPRLDWARLEEWCRQHGRAELAERYAPEPGDGIRRIGESIALVRSQLGCPEGSWEIGGDVLRGIEERSRARGMEMEP